MKKSFRYLIFVFLLVLGGVTLAACGTNKALAKEEDAFMVQAVQASSMSGNTSAYIDDNITVDSDTTISTEIKTEIKNALAEGLAEQIDELLAQIETMIDSIEITHGESDREGYEKMMSYSQVNLKGEKVEYILYYNVTDYEEEDDDDELEIEIEYKGVLVIKANGAEVEHEVTGEVEIEEGERVTKVYRENNGDKIKIESKVEGGQRKFKYVIESRLGFKQEFELEYKETRGGVKLEVELKIDDMELEYEIHIRKDGDVRKITLKIELAKFELGEFGKAEGKLEVELRIHKNENGNKHQYRIKGEYKVKTILGTEIETDIDLEVETNN